jgi:hypothetical protein
MLDILAKESDDLCEVQEQFIRFGRKPPDKTRAEHILEQVERLKKSITIIFVHADGAGNAANAIQYNCKAATDVINEKYDDLCGVPVVPVRETEAWALADATAISEVTGGRQFQVGGKPESIIDPKVPLADIAKISRALSTTALLADLADTIELGSLRELVSFRLFERFLMEQLRRLGVI